VKQQAPDCPLVDTTCAAAGHLRLTHQSGVPFVGANGIHALDSQAIDASQILVPWVRHTDSVSYTPTAKHRDCLAPRPTTTKHEVRSISQHGSPTDSHVKERKKCADAELLERGRLQLARSSSYRGEDGFEWTETVDVVISNLPDGLDKFYAVSSVSSQERLDGGDDLIPEHDDQASDSLVTEEGPDTQVTSGSAKEQRTFPTSSSCTLCDNEDLTYLEVSDAEDETYAPPSRLSTKALSLFNAALEDSD
jgi:hypothetical protein